MDAKKELKTRADTLRFGLHERTRDRSGSLHYVDTSKELKSRADSRRLDCMGKPKYKFWRIWVGTLLWIR